MSDAFTSDSLHFLRDLREENSREWYAEHKAVYEARLLKPFQALVRELAPDMLTIDPEVETGPAVGKTISRLHRDVRFSRDKSVYRDVMWFVFMRKGKGRIDYPAFFFEISPRFYRYGMGFYSATTKSMNAFRAKIAREEKVFARMVTALAKEGEFVPEGERYKKNLYSGSMEHAADWYNRKSLFAVHNGASLEDIYDAVRLRDRLRTGFLSLAGLYRFILEALDA